MPNVATSPADLLTALAGSAHLDGDRLVIDDGARFRDGGIRGPRLDRRVQRGRGDDRGRAVDRLGGQPGARRALGEHPGAVRGPRARRGLRASPCRRSTSAPRRSTWPGRSTRRADAADVGAVILELARSEQTYTFQRPIDYATSVLAGAIAAGWRGPVFIQGDHYQFNAKKYAADPEAMTEEIRRACRLAVDAGYRNIDIDASTLVDLSKPNRRRGAARELPPRGRADRAHPLARDRRRDDQRRRRDRRGRASRTRPTRSCGPTSTATAASSTAAAPGATGISKVSVQTGTSHGGVPLPDGGVAEVKLDFEVLARARRVAREYGLAGAVQHGASTLPGRAVPPLPGGRDRRDPPRDRLPERALRAPGVPGASCTRDRGVVLRQRRRRAQGRPDRSAVRLHDPQEGPRAVQAPALGPRDEGRDPRRAGDEDRVPVPRARRQRAARDGRAVRAAGRAGTGRCPAALRRRGRPPRAGTQIRRGGPRGDRGPSDRAMS